MWLPKTSSSRGLGSELLMYALVKVLGSVPFKSLYGLAGVWTEIDVAADRPREFIGMSSASDSFSPICTLWPALKMPGPKVYTGPKPGHEN